MTTPPPYPQQDPNRPDPWGQGAGGGYQSPQPYQSGSPDSAGFPSPPAYQGYPGQPGYPGAPGQPDTGGYPQQGGPGGQPGYPAYPAYPGGYPGGQTQPPPKPPAPTPVTGAFAIYVINAVLAVIGIIVVLNSSIWEQAIREADLSGTNVDVNSLISTVKTLAIGFGIAFAVLFLFFAYKMWTGRNWARITLTVLTGLSLLSAFSGGVRGTVTVNGNTYSQQTGWTGWVGVVLGALAIVLMFLPQSNQYFKTVKARRY